VNGACPAGVAVSVTLEPAQEAAPFKEEASVTDGATTLTVTAEDVVEHPVVGLVAVAV